jgi:hypothetical protein
MFSPRPCQLALIDGAKVGGMPSALQRLAMVP